MRPVKKIDTAASQRLSNEFIGTGSVRRAPDANGKDRPVLESPIKPRAPLSAKGRAGQALVEEVVLGVLDTVSDSIFADHRLTVDCGQRLGRVDLGGGQHHP